MATSSGKLYGSIPIPEKPASPRMQWTRVSEANANGSGFRPLLRQFREVFVNRVKRSHEKRIFAWLAPAGERQPAGRPQRPPQVRERQRRLREKHHPEPRGQKVETCGIERMDGRVGSANSTGNSLRAFCRARASIGPEMSTPKTWPDGATFRANAMLVAPLPQPTSMTRSPAIGLARSIRTSAMGASSISCACCRSAQRWPPGPFQYAIWSAFRSWPAGMSMSMIPVLRRGITAYHRNGANA